MPPGFVATIEEDESHFWIPLAHYAPVPLLEDRRKDILWTLPAVACIGPALRATRLDPAIALREE